MSTPSIKNPQTWVRVRRNDLKHLAIDIGNAAVTLNEKWSHDGEGRRVKQATEQISRLLDRTQIQSDLRAAFATFEEALTILEGIDANIFFIEHISGLVLSAPAREQGAFRDRLRRLASSSRDDLQAFREAAAAAQPSPSDVLSRLTPLQRLGPIEFEFSDGILSINHHPSVAGPHDKAAADQSRAALLGSAQQLAGDLASSNADRRIRQALSEVTDRIEDRRDTIALGIANISLSLVAKDCRDELADVVGALLQAFSVNVGMYVAQFPEWVRFAENAAIAEYATEDVEAVYNAGLKLVEQLTKIDQGVDPEVPRTIRWILEAIRNPRAAAKRSVFGAIRTVENFVTIIFRTFADLLSTVRDASLKGIGRAVTPVVTGLLLLAAADVAQSVSPTAAKVMQSRWLGEAAEVVRKEVEKNSALGIHKD